MAAEWLAYRCEFGSLNLLRCAKVVQVYPDEIMPRVLADVDGYDRPLTLATLASMADADRVVEQLRYQLAVGAGSVIDMDQIVAVLEPRRVAVAVPA
jgi:hypothetical protein